MQKFTHEQLIQYVYGEASPILKLAIEKALESNADIQKEIKKIKKSKKELDNLKHKSYSPSKKTIDAVLAYAKSTVAKKQ